MVVRVNGEEDLLPTYAAIAGSLLGVCGAIILIVLSLTTPAKAMSKRIIIVISIADILIAFPTLLSASLHVERDHSHEDLEKFMDIFNCKLQSFFITSGSMLMFLWTFGLSQHMFLLVKFGVEVAYKMYLSLYALSVIPFVINMLAFQYDVLGIDDKYLVRDEHGFHHQSHWCWINVTDYTMHNGTWLKQACPAALWDGKGFEIFSYIGVTVYCIMAHWELRRIATYEQILDDSEEIILSNANNEFYAGSTLRINKILAIPILFIFTRIWGTIAQLSCYCFVGNTLAHGICASTAFQCLQNFFDPLQGFVNLILYKLTLGNCNSGCMIRCPSLLYRLRRLRRRRRPVSSYEPATMWIDQEDSSGFM